MRNKIILFLLVGIATANADILNSTQRFLGQSDPFSDYANGGSGKVDGLPVDEVPYSPADSDLGVQQVLAKREDVAPVTFNLSTAILRTDNAAGSNEPSWLTSTSAVAAWRPLLFDGWFGDVGVGADYLRFDDKAAADYENYSGRLGIYKSFPDLDDTIFFVRYEYQFLSSGSVTNSDYNAQRIRAGVLKTLYVAPRQSITAGVSGALEWSAHPKVIQRDEIEGNLTYRYAFTDNIYMLTSARVSRFEYQDFGRDDWTYGLGIQLIWELTKNLQVSASISYDKNDSNSGVATDEFQSWTGGLGIGCQWAF